MITLTSTTAVQPSKRRNCTGKSNQLNDFVVQLVENGGDEDAAEALVERLTGGKPPADKFQAAAIHSFIELVTVLSNSGGRLTTVS